jgi:lysophospholipase L1-like esterase
MAAAVISRKIMILGDSHCRGMDEALKICDPSIHTLAIIHPRGTRAITARYRSAVSCVYDFTPEYIFIHCGHNDLVFHSSLNPSPINSEDTRTHTIDLALLLQRNHPDAKIIISALFPRTFTYKSTLLQEEVSAFNRLAKRHGQRLRSQASMLPIPILVALNMPLWRRISKSEETAKLFLPDGLHINNDGKKALAGAWLSNITTPLSPLEPTRDNIPPTPTQY